MLHICKFCIDLTNYRSKILSEKCRKNSPFILCLQLQVLYAELPISYKDLIICGLWFAQVVLEPIPTDPGGQLFSVCTALHWYQLLFNAMWRASYPKITYSSPLICCAFLFYIIISADVNILIYSFTRLIFLLIVCTWMCHCVGLSIYVQVPTEFKRRCLQPWSWSYRWFEPPNIGPENWTWML